MAGPEIKARSCSVGVKKERGQKKIKDLKFLKSERTEGRKGQREEKRGEGKKERRREKEKMGSTE